MESAPGSDRKADDICPSCGSPAESGEVAPWTAVTCAQCGTMFHRRTRFHQFEILEQIGSGGMSRVFRARDTSLQRDVALKILNSACGSEKHRIEQFMREAQITARIAHPNVVKVYSASREQGDFYIAMELVEGGSLDDRLEDGPLAERDALEVALAAAEGLRAARSHGLLHRDIKPANILFANDGTPRIVDFGLAMVEEEALRTGELWATPYYAPPETLLGVPEDFRSDIYRLGATLFHALTGAPPFDRDTSSLETLKQVKAKPLEWRSAAGHLHPETIAVLRRSLQRKPADRYGSYDEFIDHLTAARKALRRGGRHRPWKPPQETPGRGRPVAVGAVAVAVSALAAWAAWQDPPRPAAGPLPDDWIVGPPPVAAVADSVAVRFLAARDALFARDYPRAGRLFAAVADDPDALQPTRNRARYNAGIAALFTGDEPGSRRWFAAIRQDPGTAPAPADAELLRFLERSSRWLEGSLPVPLTHRSDCPPGTVRMVGLVPAGLKNWALGSLDESLPFLQTFASGRSPSDASWIDGYKQLVQPYLEDARLAATVRAADDSATADRQELEQRLRLAREARSRLALPHGPARRAVDAAIASCEAALR